MANYNFYNLSSTEFEELSRDLLQEHLRLTLESFADRYDTGIDFRHAGKKLIVQCKRYVRFASLFKKLKSEVKKAAALKPKTYILTTSVSLDPIQKGKIIKLFRKYTRSGMHIYARKDLNNLLNLYPKVETRHFKLWLPSVNTLQRVLHGKIFTQTDFEWSDIKKTQQVYVENDSFFAALDILRKNKFVIITGIPGVGKSTLSRVLVLYFIKNGYEEFYSLSQSISEANEVFKPNVKQVFFYDDFLGRNFLDQKLLINEESLIIKFLEKVSQSKDKIIILNTRDYILAQAIQRYEAFKSMRLQKGRYIVNLEEYTHPIRERILYNHIIFSKASKRHIDNLLSDDNYKKVVRHPNFNPRIIDLIFDKPFLQKIRPGKLTETLLANMDDPFEVWDHVYKNDISKLSQLLLAELVTINDSIFSDDLKLIVQVFCQKNFVKYKVSCSELDFVKSLQELEGTFLQFSRDKKEQVRIDFKNPSAADYMLRYLDNSPDLVEDLIMSAVFFNQLITIFISDEGARIFSPVKGQILISGRLLERWKEKIKNDFSTMEYSLFKYSISDLDSVKESYSDYDKLWTLLEWGQFSQDEQIRNFVRDEFEERLFPEELDDFRSYVNLLMQFNGEYDCDWFELLDSVFFCTRSLEDILEFQKFNDLFQPEFQDFVENEEEYERRIQYIMDMSAKHCDDFDLDEVLADINKVCEITGVDGNKAKLVAKKRLKKHEAFLVAEGAFRHEKVSNSKKGRIETEPDIFDNLKKAVNRKGK